jgi:hypothetical protein
MRVVELPTRRLRQLERRVASLDQSFLPKISPTGSYSARQYDRVRAYVVLVHAEMEAFVEELVSQALVAARSRWATTARTGKCVAALMMYNARDISAPAALGTQKTAHTFDAVIKKVIADHERTVLQNHGIRESNLLKILLPIGVLENELDPVWLANVNSFGQSRGIVAHTSARAVQTLPDPADARGQVRAVMSGLVDLEQTVKGLFRA